MSHHHDARDGLEGVLLPLDLLFPDELACKILIQNALDEVYVFVEEGFKVRGRHRLVVCGCEGRSSLFQLLEDRLLAVVVAKDSADVVEAQFLLLGLIDGWR